MFRPKIDTAMSESILIKIYDVIYTLFVIEFKNMYFHPQTPPPFFPPLKKKSIDLFSNGCNILHVLYYDTLNSQHTNIDTGNINYCLYIYFYIYM